jgi:hypothetical protein
MNKQVYVGGDIAEVSGVPAGGVAVFDGSKWSALGLFFIFIFIFLDISQRLVGRPPAAWPCLMQPSNNGVL